ncbi:MAG: ornithine cyclodeaminase family protein [Rhodoglobus sp.]|nr:ornithine cyclodeaminase family protein [Rhodoglobus sp.]
MLVISRSDLDHVFGMSDAFAAVAEAARAWSSGTVMVPPRIALRARATGVETLVMPGTVEDTFTGAKIWYAAGDDPGRLPTSSAIIVLIDPTLGEVLLDGELITDLRTGAMTGLAAQQLAPRDASIVSVLGAGIQARAQVLALIHAIPTLSEVRISSRNDGRRDAFVSALARELANAGSSAAVRSVGSPEDACRGADILVAATTARAPVIEDAWVADNALVCGVGSHDRDSAEISRDTVARCGVVVVDTKPGGIDGAGDIADVIAEGRLEREDVLELGQILDGIPASHADREGPRMLKTVGFAAADLIAARAATRLALAANLGRTICLHDRNDIAGEMH